jgi:hypothetical protein
MKINKVYLKKIKMVAGAGERTTGTFDSIYFLISSLHPLSNSGFPLKINY